MIDNVSEKYNNNNSDCYVIFDDEVKPGSNKEHMINKIINDIGKKSSRKSSKRSSRKPSKRSLRKSSKRSSRKLSRTSSRKSSKRSSRKSSKKPSRKL